MVNGYFCSNTTHLWTKQVLATEVEYGHQEGRTTTVEGVGAEPALSPQDCQLFLLEFELFKGVVYKFYVGEGVHGTVTS